MASLENTVNTDKSVCWEYTHSSKQKVLIVALGLLGIMILKPDFPFCNQVKRKLIHESGHPRIVLKVIGMKETNFSKSLCHQEYILIRGMPQSNVFVE